MAARDDIQQVAAALAPPRAGYPKRLEQAQRAIAARDGDASHQLGLFAGRIADLTLDELQELHDETFHADRAIGTLLGRLIRGRTGPAEASAALLMLAPLLDRLESERNPHSHGVRALCSLLRLRVKRSGATERPGRIC